MPYSVGVTSSGLLTNADTTKLQVMTGPGAFVGLDVTAPGLLTSVVRVYDGTDTYGTCLAICEVLAGESSNHFEYPGVQVNKGIFIDKTDIADGTDVIARFCKG
jgi:hypothetical protein